MLGDSLKMKDNLRTDALQRSLLMIEHSTDAGFLEQSIEAENDNFMLPPSEFVLGKAMLTMLYRF